MTIVRCKAYKHLLLITQLCKVITLINTCIKFINKNYNLKILLIN